MAEISNRDFSLLFSVTGLEARKTETCEPAKGWVVIHGGPKNAEARNFVFVFFRYRYCDEKMFSID